MKSSALLIPLSTLSNESTTEGLLEAAGAAMESSRSQGRRMSHVKGRRHHAGKVLWKSAQKSFRTKVSSVAFMVPLSQIIED